MHNSIKVVTAAFSDIARCLPPTPLSCTDSEENSSTSGAGYVANSILLILSRHSYTSRHAIDLHVHESCQHACSGEG